MKRFLTVLATVAVCATPASAKTITDAFTSFYSFGDSLTDDGKLGLAGAGGLLEPPSFGGRFSNGFTWSEYIEDAFAVESLDARNYALGAATAGPVNPVNPTGPLGTLDKQIDAFGAELLASLRDPGDNPLVSLWLGANDILRGLDPVEAANFLTGGVRRIADIGTALGETFDDFLIISQLTNPFVPGGAEAFNAQLTANIAGLRADGLNIITFDPANVVDAIVTDTLTNGALEFGITELSTPCAASFIDGDPASCLDLGLDPDTFFFMDPVHPSGPVHLLTSQQVSATIEASIAPVPLPASLPLLLVGVGAVGVLRLRRRAA